MGLQQELVSIEQRLWTGGARTYRQNLDEDCLIAFTEMAGVSKREDVAGTVNDVERWRDIEIDVEGFLQPTEDVALLTYRASAIRGQGEQYRALISSGYVNRDGTWRLMFHQQTPLPGQSAGPG
jgi:hypothetical protein